MTRSTSVSGAADRQSGLAFDGLIVDLDGVVWLGAKAVPGSVAALGTLRARGVRLLFVTNDPRSSRADYAARLRALGVVVEESQVLTSGATLAAFVREREGVEATVYVIGSPALRAEFERAGLALLAEDAGQRADAVAVGGHPGFDYDELRIASRAVRRGARLYAAGRDPIFPMPDGPWPGTGAIVAAVEVAGGREAVSVGKPEPFMFARARELLTGCRSVAVVGDSLASDIAGGSRAGLTTILVLSGTSGREDIAATGVSPDFVLPNLSALVALGPRPASSDRRRPPSDD